jgi:LmbE family N-acetylglucosaminyl deacetylase
MKLGKKAKRRVWVYGTLVTLLGGGYWYQPVRIDLVKRVPKNPLPQLDPDSKTLFKPGTKVAVVVAHPDDPEFYIGGTLDQLGKAGAEITVIVITDGDKGYYPPGFTDSEKNRKIRREEQTRASAKYKAKVEFLGERDGRLRSDERTTALVANALRRLAPDYLLCFDDYYWPRASHSDHRHAGILSIAAAKEVPSIRWIMRFGTTGPNFATDITKSWDTKECLIQEHVSQFSGMKLEGVTNMVRGFAETTGEEFGYEVAEGFRCSRK